MGSQCCQYSQQEAQSLHMKHRQCFAFSPEIGSERRTGSFRLSSEFSLWTSAFFCLFFLQQKLSCSDNTEVVSLPWESLFFLLPLFPTFFNHFSAVGSFWFPFVSFCQFDFLLYNINPLVLRFFRLLLCSLTCYTCFSNFKKMC